MKVDRADLEMIPSRLLVDGMITDEKSKDQRSWDWEIEGTG